MHGVSHSFMTWGQTRIDGDVPSIDESIVVGSNWSWIGETFHLNGENTSFILTHPNGWRWLKNKAAQTVAKMQARCHHSKRINAYLDDPLLNGSFVVSDGTRNYSVIPIERQNRHEPLLLLPDGIPPARTPLTIIEVRPSTRESNFEDRGVLCFTPDTLVATETGQRAVEDLFPGDRLLTKDNGPQEILWMGVRQVSGTRLYIDPSLRPVRIRAGAFGEGEPYPDLVVSSDHRILLTHQKAQALFNTPEVLVRAIDLIDDQKIMIDHSVREIAYVHMLLPQHEVIWANGIETESFHPSAADLSHLNALEHHELAEIIPGFEHTADTYGPFARRCLNRAEASLMQNQNVPHYLS